MHFIQKNIFSEKHYQDFIDIMERFDLPHQIVEIIPFTTDVIFEPVETNKIFCWGSVKFANISRNYGWTPGSFYNKNHDYRVYSQYYKENMLNYDSQILKFGDKFTAPGTLFFARPCEDLKSFSGQVFVKDSWNEFVEWHLKNNKALDENTSIQVCRIKDIQREVRVCVVKGQIVTASQYRINERTVFQECSDPFILDYAQKMVDVYQPAEAFVIDIAVCDGELKVVEINCINCAGFYESNLQKLIMSIDDNFLD